MEGVAICILRSLSSKLCCHSTTRQHTDERVLSFFTFSCTLHLGAEETSAIGGGAGRQASRQTMAAVVQRAPN